MARFKDADWGVRTAEGKPHCADNVHEATLAVLMDLRDELKRINVRLDCHETLAIPRLLRTIASNTKRKKRSRKPKAA